MGQRTLWVGGIGGIRGILPGLIGGGAVVLLLHGAAVNKEGAGVTQVVDCDKYPIRLEVGGETFYCSPSVISFQLDARVFGDCTAASSGNKISIAFRALTADLTIGIRECSEAQLEFQPRPAAEMAPAAADNQGEETKI